MSSIRGKSGGGTEPAKEITGSQTYVISDEDCEKWISVEVSGERYSIETDEYEGITCSDKIFFSKLPIVCIDVENGSDITSKTEYVNSTISVQGNEQFKSQLKSAKAEIKGRGNSSWWGYSQKSYKIKLDKKSDLFNMGKNKHWVLISNFFDNACLRNITGSRLSKRLGLENMDMEWVDVVLNGDYAGTYILSEHIRVGDTRINIKDWESIAEDAADAVYDYYATENDLKKADKKNLETLMTEDLSWISSGIVEYKGITFDVVDAFADYETQCREIHNGYLFEMSEEYDEVSKFATDTGILVMLNKPEFLCTNDEMFQYAQDFWNEYDRAASTIDGYNEKEKSVYDYADLDSMVAYWLTMEIMGNNDAVYKSRYAYLDYDNKLHFGPVWDFDWGCATRVVGSYPNGWKISGGTLWTDWLDDPFFLNKAVDMYWANHDYLEDLVKEDGILEGYYEYIKEAGNASSARWDYNPGFQTDYDVFIQYLRNRIEWLDQQFTSVETLTKSLLGASRYQYLKMSNIDIDIPGAEDIDGEYHVDDTESISLSVVVEDTDVNKVWYTVNGAGRTFYDIDGTVGITVAKENIYESGNNIIAFYAAADDEILYTNYCVVGRLEDDFKIWNTEGTVTRVRGVDEKCTSDGSIEYWIDIDSGKIYSDRKLSKEIGINDIVITHTGHPWDSGVVTTKATTDTEGVMTFTCTVCGDTYTKPIAKLQYTAPGTVSGLVYDGTSKSLISDGSATGGTMYYALV